jgi:integrase
LCRLRVCDLRRIGKVTSLSGVELDLDALGVWCAVLAKHKTMDKSKDRVVFFGPAAKKWLVEVLKDRKVGLSGVGGVGGKDPLFPNEDRNHFTPPALQNKVRRACIRRGVDGWQVYSLRHTLAVKVQQKYGRDAARAVLGHTGGVTGGYAGADLMTAAKVMAEMG